MAGAGCWVSCTYCSLDRERDNGGAGDHTLGKGGGVFAVEQPAGAGIDEAESGLVRVRQILDVEGDDHIVVGLDEQHRVEHANRSACSKLLEFGQYAAVKLGLACGEHENINGSVFHLRLLSYLEWACAHMVPELTRR